MTPNNKRCIPSHASYYIQGQATIQYKDGSFVILCFDTEGHTVGVQRKFKSIGNPSSDVMVLQTMENDKGTSINHYEFVISYSYNFLHTGFI